MNDGVFQDEFTFLWYDRYSILHMVVYQVTYTVESTVSRSHLKLSIVCDYTWFNYHLRLGSMVFYLVFCGTINVDIWYYDNDIGIWCVMYMQNYLPHH